MGGSFLGDDDPDGSSQLEGNDTVMSDMSYDAHPEDADMPEEERRRLSMKSQHIQGNTNFFSRRYSPISISGYTPTTTAYHAGYMIPTQNLVQI